MAGQPKSRERKRRQLEETAKREHLSAIYAEEFTTFEAMRAFMVQNGIVEHGINPYDCIQRAIDDTATDYLLLRRKIDLDTHGDPTKLESHPLYFFMEHVREAMVRYSTFAMQYDIQRRSLKLSEARIALLANTLRAVCQQLGLTADQIKAVPALLTAQLQLEQANSNGNKNVQPTRFDANKATALAEIMHNDTEVVIEYDD